MKNRNSKDGDRSTAAENEDQALNILSKALEANPHSEVSLTGDLKSENAVHFIPSIEHIASGGHLPNIGGGRRSYRFI